MEIKEFIEQAIENCNYTYGDLREVTGLDWEDEFLYSSGMEHKLFQAIDKMIAEDLWICPIIQHMEEKENYYTISKHEIHVKGIHSKHYRTLARPREAFVTDLFHEMVHSTGFANLFKRFDGQCMCAKTYWMEEFIAELGAVIVAQHYHLTKHIKSETLPFVHQWLQCTSEDFESAIQKAKEAATHIIYVIHKVMNEIMPTRAETQEFLDGLQWKRYTKKELQNELQSFFKTGNKLENGTCLDCKDIDYSFLFTNGNEASTRHFIDVEIYYLKMRRRNNVLITGAEILMYEK